MTIQTGTRLGSYEITGLIGAGGMGEVYRARDTKLNRDVAIKVLPPAFANDRDRLMRFEREAQSLAALNHPRIAQIYGLLELLPESGSHTALVMEFADGEDLSARISRGAIPLADALPIAIQIAEALEAAHERAIVHRDLKPANIKITEDGSVKVLDFGLAKAMASDVSSAGQEIQNSPTFTSPAMTQMGVILGTAAYMAPEQAKGRATDRRADVWAFGGVLFEMLTAQRAFAGEDVTDTIAAIIRSEPNWAAIPPGTPAAIHKLLRRCLEKDRAKRLDSMAVARFELQEAMGAPDLVSAPTSSAPPPAPRWRILAPYLATAAAVALLVGLPAWMIRPEATPPVVRFAIELPQGQSMGGSIRLQMAISPDAAMVAYVANREIYLRSLDAMQPIRLYDNPAKLPIAALVFSPDRESLVFWSDGAIRRIATGGGVPTTVTEAKELVGILWAGEALIYSTAHKIFRVPASGGQPEELLSVPDDEFLARPALLPDGRTLLFALAKGTGIERWDDAVIVAQRIGESSRTTLVPRATEPRYLPGGYLAYVQSGVVFAAPFDPEERKLTGNAVPVVEGVARGIGMTFGGSAHYVVSESGTLAYLPGPKESSSRVRSILVLADGGSGVEPLKVATGLYGEPRLSPDGRYIAYAADDSKESNIWIVDVKQGGPPRRLTFGGAERFPVWAPDSTRLVYQVQREKETAVFSQRADGSDAPTRLTTPEAGTSHVPHAFAKDGTLWLDVQRGDTVTLMTRHPRTGALTPFGGVVSTVITSPTVSPDGRWVTYTVRTTGQSSQVFVQPVPATGALYQVSKPTEDGHHSVWARDGKTLFYTPGPGPLLIAVPVATSPAFTMGESRTLNRQFANQPTQISRPFDVTLDGRFLGVGSATGGGTGVNTIYVVLNWIEEVGARFK